MMAQVIVGEIAGTEIDGTRLSLPEDAGNDRSDDHHQGEARRRLLWPQKSPIRVSNKRPTDASDTWMGFSTHRATGGSRPGLNVPDGHTSAFSMASTPCFE